MLLLSSAESFQKHFFRENYFKNTIRVSNHLDSDQDRRSVHPDLDTNCLRIGYQQTAKVAANKERDNHLQRYE